MKWYNDRVLTDTDSCSWAPIAPCKHAWAVTVWPLTLNTATGAHPTEQETCLGNARLGILE